MKTFFMNLLATLAVLLALFAFANRNQLGDVLKNTRSKTPEITSTPTPLPTPEIIYTRNLTATGSAQPTATTSSKLKTLPQTGFPTFFYLGTFALIGMVGYTLKRST